MYRCQWNDNNWMKYQRIQIFFLLLWNSIFIAANFNCEKKPKERCLEDCKWSKRDNKCKDCAVGFYGHNCSRPCRYPNYGRACQSDCSHCGLELCDSISGCPTVTVVNDCSAGFYGNNCSKPCRYPNYGRSCQEYCSQCAEEHCNSISGCPTVTVYVQDAEIEVDEDKTNTLVLDPVLIGIITSTGFLLVLVSFIIVTILNRRHFVRHTRRRVHYIDSVMLDLYSTNTLPRTNTTESVYINNNNVGSFLS